MSLQSNWNSHKYAEKPTVAKRTIIEPVQRNAFNTSSSAVAARYCQLTGFPADCVFIDKDGQDYTARVAILRAGVPDGTSRFVGRCGWVAGKNIITDTFRIEALEQAEFMYRK